jgi:hypothetical protein
VNWIYYKPIMRGLCTMHELRTVYTLDDLMDFHDAIDEWDEAHQPRT